MNLTNNIITIIIVIIIICYKKQHRCYRKKIKPKNKNPD